METAYKKLVIVACDCKPAEIGGSTRVLRLAGAAKSGEVPPEQLLTLSRDVSAAFLKRYPQWLYRWVRESGVLDLAVWPGMISWWWYTPMSEKSPLRSKLLHQLYQLMLVREVIDRDRPISVTWYGDDKDMADILACICEEMVIALDIVLIRRSGIPLLTSALKRLLAFFYDMSRIFVARVLFAKQVQRDETVKAVLFSRFPVLWEEQLAGWHERMFGQWPDKLSAQQVGYSFAVTLTDSPVRLVNNYRKYKRLFTERHIIPLESVVRLRDIITAHAMFSFSFRYINWRSKLRSQRVVFEKLDVTALLWRELDSNALDNELPRNRWLSRAWTCVVRNCPNVRMVFHPFEYQPMERAIWSGVKSALDISVIGIQTGLYTSSHMGFDFLPEEIRLNGDPLNAPIPDFLTAYGELAYNKFSARMGADRVLLLGAIRYAQLANERQQCNNCEDIVEQMRLPTGKRFMLVATGMQFNESVPLIQGAFTLAARDPELHLLFKCHYHMPLEKEIKRLSEKNGISRYSVFEKDLYTLMRISYVMLTGGSSTAYEAIALDCTPLIYLPVHLLSSSPAIETPDAFAFWYSEDELINAYEGVLNGDELWHKRKQNWQCALEAQMWPLEATEQRLYEKFEPLLTGAGSESMA